MKEHSNKGVSLVGDLIPPVNIWLVDHMFTSQVSQEAKQLYPILWPWLSRFPGVHQSVLLSVAHILAGGRDLISPGQSYFPAGKPHLVDPGHSCKQESLRMQDTRARHFSTRPVNIPDWI